MAQVGDSDVVLVAFNISDIEIAGRSVRIVTMLHVAVITFVILACIEVGVGDGGIVALRLVLKSGAFEGYPFHVTVDPL